MLAACTFHTPGAGQNLLIPFKVWAWKVFVFLSFIEELGTHQFARTSLSNEVLSRSHYLTTDHEMGGKLAETFDLDVLGEWERVVPHPPSVDGSLSHPIEWVAEAVRGKASARPRVQIFLSVSQLKMKIANSLLRSSWGKLWTLSMWEPGRVLSLCAQ